MTISLLILGSIYQYYISVSRDSCLLHVICDSFFNTLGNQITEFVDTFLYILDTFWIANLA